MAPHDYEISEVSEISPVIKKNVLIGTETKRKREYKQFIISYPSLLSGNQNTFLANPKQSSTSVLLANIKSCRYSVKMRIWLFSDLHGEARRGEKWGSAAFLFNQQCKYIKRLGYETTYLGNQEKHNLFWT